MNLGTKVNLTRRLLKTGPLIKTLSENNRVPRLPKKRIQPSLVGIPYLSLACKGGHIMAPESRRKAVSTQPHQGESTPSPCSCNLRLSLLPQPFLLCFIMQMISWLRSSHFLCLKLKKKSDNFLSKSSSLMKFYKNRYNQRKIKFHR